MLVAHLNSDTNNQACYYNEFECMYVFVYLTESHMPVCFISKDMANGVLKKKGCYIYTYIYK